MEDSNLANNYIRNISEYKKRGRGIRKPEDFQNMTKTFEDQYKSNCNCPSKKARSHSYKLCDCSDDKK
jgi:hypothetical protein